MQRGQTFKFRVAAVKKCLAYFGTQLTETYFKNLL